MVDKLQELTDKLYNEGLSKGKKEADELLSKAKAEAQKIIESANEQASQIVSSAKKEADELKRKAEGDIKIASLQTISAVKQKLENSIVSKTLSEPTKSALEDKQFLQNIIQTVANSFNTPEGGKSIDLILSENQKEQLESFVKGKISEFCKSGSTVSFSKEIESGFKVGEKENGYYVDFTNNSFEKIIAEYIRPKTRKLLFGE